MRRSRAGSTTSTREPERDRRSAGACSRRTAPAREAGADEDGGADVLVQHPQDRGGRSGVQPHLRITGRAPDAVVADHAHLPFRPAQATSQAVRSAGSVSASRIILIASIPSAMSTGDLP
ncbi:hypothetical protein [Streptomyces sp. 840.1]|uniref:hypothetical protein n=1 Tax=Streptomyces sp. 840.1 TaxID=2485152 RepID=UPI0021A89CE1|nr:hypothetical protein [Streptomyces sp. 840.1]